VFSPSCDARSDTRSYRSAVSFIM